MNVPFVWINSLLKKCKSIILYPLGALACTILNWTSQTLYIVCSIRKCRLFVTIVTRKKQRRENENREKEIG
jgi:hypothetical protein